MFTVNNVLKQYIAISLPRETDHGAIRATPGVDEVHVVEGVRAAPIIIKNEFEASYAGMSPRDPLVQPMSAGFPLSAAFSHDQARWSMLAISTQAWLPAFHDAAADPSRNRRPIERARQASPALAPEPTLYLESWAARG